MKREGWLLKQGILLTLIAVMTAVISFGKEAVFANYFGVSAVADAYTIAIQIPEILFAIIWETINVVVIPLYTEKLHIEGKKAASRFFGNLLSIIGVVSLGSIFLGEIFANGIIIVFAPGISAETHELAVSLTRWIFPMLFFEGIIRVATGVLNVHDQFVVPRLLTTVRNIGVIVFLVLFAERFGIYAAAVGILTGIFIECVLCVITTTKYERLNVGIDIKDPSIVKAGRMALPLVLGIGARELNHMADKIVASFLNAGSISSLNYASKISSIIEVVLLSNLVTLLYPRYSVLASEGRKKELIETYEKTVRICLLLCVPIVFGAIFLRNEIVSLAFERGEFGKDSVVSVANLFAIYVLSALFTTINGASVKLFTSCYDTATTTVNSVIGVVVNIILNVVLSCYFGAIGLAVATLISSLVICLRLFLQAREKVFYFDLHSMIVTLAKSLLAGTIMFLGLVVFRMISGSFLETTTILGMLIYCACSVLIGVIMYGISIVLLNVEEVSLFLNQFRRQL